MWCIFYCSPLDSRRRQVRRASYSGVWTGHSLPTTASEREGTSHCFCWPSIIVGFGFQLNTNSRHMGRGNLNREIDSISLAYGPICGALIWLMIDTGRPSSLWVVPTLSKSGPGLYKKNSWANQRKPASKQCSFMFSASCSASMFLSWVPALASLHDGL